MNEWVKHYGGEFDRRVHRREFQAQLGCGSTWFRQLELRGVIPPARVDPGGKRKWWPASEVRHTLSKLQEASVPAPRRTPPGAP